MKSFSRIFKAVCFMAAFLCLIKLGSILSEYAAIEGRINEMQNEYVSFSKEIDKSRQSEDSFFYSDKKRRMGLNHPYYAGRLNDCSILDDDETGKEIPDIDFDNLLKVNPDIICWIYIPGTNISFPLLKSYDNAEYLSLDFRGNYSVEGSIFLDYRCNFDSDGYKLIYGHNMHNGAMFGELDLYQNESYIKNHRIIYLLKPDGTAECYRIFSSEIVTTEDEIYDVETMKDTGSDIMILSTCTDDRNTDKRLAVYSKKLLA